MAFFGFLAPPALVCRQVFPSITSRTPIGVYRASRTVPWTTVKAYRKRICDMRVRFFQKDG
jgi:hypothetical protein